MILSNKTSFSKQCNRSRTCTPIKCHMSLRSAFNLGAPSRSIFTTDVFSVDARRAFKPCKATTELEAAAHSTQEKTKNPLNLVFVATEVAPWSKTGVQCDVDIVFKPHLILSKFIRWPR
jgi:hypothetical protein